MIIETADLRLKFQCLWSYQYNRIVIDKRIVIIALSIDEVKALIKLATVNNFWKI